MKKNLLLRTALFLNIGFLIINATQHTILNWLTGAFIINTVALILLANADKDQWKELSTWIDPTKFFGNTHEAVKNYLKETKDFVLQVQVAFDNINSIGQAEFINLIAKVKNEKIRSPLLLANEKIIELGKKEKENNWISQGMAAIAELKHRGNNIKDYSYQIIFTIVKYLNANQGAFFLLKGEDTETYFELTAAYAYGRKKYLEKRIYPGEGLIGQVFYEKEIIYLTDVPKDYIRITSGLGDAPPCCVCIVPILSDEKIQGALEIASFNLLQWFEIEYLKKIGENIGYNLNSIEIHNRTEQLLEEARSMAAELKSQEEELRQNMEELSATQEQMERKHMEMDSLLSSLSVIELDLNGKILDANKIFLGTTGYSLSEITGKHYNFLSHNEDQAQFEIMWNSILSGRNFSGEFKILNHDKKEIWMAGNFAPMFNDKNQPYKVTVITVFTTRDKEKMMDLQEMVSAFKACLPVAEINSDLSFKSANDLFLSEIGVRRLDLKKSSPQSVFQEDSIQKLQKYLADIKEQPQNTILDIFQKNGITRGYHSTLFKLNHNGSNRTRGLVILKNTL